VISIVIISKNESGLSDTLAAVTRQTEALSVPCEILVVDASDGALDGIKERHQEQVRWIPFQQPVGVSTTIPQQRNTGVLRARGEIIVFTDAGCVPEPGWLDELTAPLFSGEHVTHGLTLGARGGMKLHDRTAVQRLQSPYLVECSTINTAFRRVVYNAVGGFDESFTYGSDVDFSWRLVDAGYRIRSVPNAVVRHDWGTTRRQARRAFLYGKARTRLYQKHPARLRHVFRKDPMVVAYPLFLLGLPLTFIFPLYPALLLIPAWRNREDGAVHVVFDHLIFGAGILAELVRL
jgi:GT2 family glycosyltransferase